MFRFGESENAEDSDKAEESDNAGESAAVPEANGSGGIAAMRSLMGFGSLHPHQLQSALTGEGEAFLTKQVTDLNGPYLTLPYLLPYL